MNAISPASPNIYWSTKVPGIWHGRSCRVSIITGIYPDLGTIGPPNVSWFVAVINMEIALEALNGVRRPERMPSWRNTGQRCTSQRLHVALRYIHRPQSYDMVSPLRPMYRL